jgi:hypothetical protein
MVLITGFAIQEKHGCMEARKRHKSNLERSGDVSF